MSALDTQPDTLNFLSPLNFKFSIKKCPSINFFAQKVNIPGMNNGSALSFNPFVKLPYAGDHIEFESMMVSFKVDEKLQNYLEIYHWIQGLGFPENWQQYKTIKDNPTFLGTGVKSDISILVLDSAKIPFYECVLIDAYPVGLSGINFSSVETDVTFVTAEATFQYTYLNMVDLSVGH